MEPKPILEKRLLPPWLAYCLLTIVFWGLWGVQSKLILEEISPLSNQVLFTPGLLLMVGLLWLRLRKSRSTVTGSLKLGIFFAFLTGVCGGVGNIAFFEALKNGRQASIVVPLTALYPMVTVLLAMIFLGEKMNRYQWVGLGLAIGAIIILGS